MITIQINELEEVHTFLKELPKNIDKELTKANGSFMLNVLVGAKSRAPKDTGDLGDSIKLKPVRIGKNVKKWKLVVESPYALFQEEGFTPHSFFAGKGFNSLKMPAGRMYTVSKWTPFVKPALENQLKTFSEKLNNAMEEAIKK